jgi:outer membrane protein OmpA-like peptidoglycan-associated protein
MHLDFDHMSPASQFGPEFLTYVLWGITPEGNAKNLGEIVMKGGGDKAQLDATTELQAFGMIVTAEPYWAVSEPSDVVVMENFVRGDTTGTMEDVDAKYELLKRGAYTMNLNPNRLPPLTADTRVPLQLREAREAVAIARATGAERYANDTLQKALIDLQNAEGYLIGRSGTKPLETVAREATQMAEDARLISIRKMQAEDLANERAAAAKREADARASADDEARRRAQADSARLAAEQQSEANRLAAERARTEAAQLTAQAERDRAASEAARQAALAQQQQAQADAERARLAAADAEAQRQKAEAEKAEMRERLRTQLNVILATRDTARGLIVNISDVLFDFNKSTLKPGAREKLAKVSGIVLAYPGLRLALEGHTDSIGSDEYNQVLSEKRAFAVRDYLVAQGVNGNNVTAIGKGKSEPVASNDNAAGRQQNRRVDMVVSGDIIGTPINPPNVNPPSASLPPR